VLALALPAAAAPADAVVMFNSTIKPLLTKYCYDCHADGVNKGKVAFDELTDAGIAGNHELWLKALRNVRAGTMPPREEGEEDFRPNAAEIETLARWIKYDAFGIDPANPDPGRVTMRRLNRVEYRNTIRDLLGFDFNSEAEVPPDDTGNGFDNNGDVLTISPLLLEKYLTAAEFITERAVPKVAKVMKERVASAGDFRREGAREGGMGGMGGRGGGQGLLNVKNATKISKKFTVEENEDYKLAIDLEVRGSFDFDPNRCNIICRVDGEERFVQEIVWAERKNHKFNFDLKWTAGEHVVEFEIVPLTPVETPDATRPNRRQLPDVAAPVVAANTPDGAAPAAGAAGEVPVAGPASLRRPSVAQATAARLDVRIANVTVSGPINNKFWVMPEPYAKFYPKGPAPEEPVARDRYAAEVIQRFATKAFRRPVEEAKVRQLAAIAKATYTQPGKTFEDGISRAAMATLASPRFLFRAEEPVKGTERQAFAPVDEYALATRLSYFLWSTMPDDALFELAEKGELRKQLRAQVDRMLKDARAQAFVKDFTGQWLQARDIEFVPINAREVLGIRGGRGGNANAPRIDFDGPIRKLMRTETEMYFNHILKEDRSVLELVDSDYTFLNERLASHYGVPDVTGDQLHLVKLPPDSPRGGVLTQGSFLAVTSNPTRTSPVKRGLFVLENILGTPPPPPPPDIPDLEEAKKEFKDREPKISEMLAAHRANALCSSCHQRMDPLGLAFENFNAMGMWRTEDAKQPIEPAGQLITGEKFADVRELKQVLVTSRRNDVFRCMAEKLLTYALGRGLEAYDMHTIDEIVARLNREEGRMSALLFGVIESTPFQKQRTPAAEKLAEAVNEKLTPATLAKRN